MSIEITRPQWFLMSKGVTEERLVSHTETGLRGCHWGITRLFVILIADQIHRDYITITRQELVVYV